ncbi:hypothetical protein [Sphingobium yanoikuyae]|uniref:hypothetical protein n=1 Tax=Sphingobium yanoikuyae TaxID=13690 RepID=UPI0035C78D54
MGVTKTNAYDGPFYPNGVTTSFPFTFRTMSASEVIILTEAGKQISGFSFSIVPSVNADGGTIVFDTPPTAIELPSFLIGSDPNFGVGIDLGSVTAFNPRTLNPSFERLAVQNIFLQERMNRSVQVPFGEKGPELPSLSAADGKFLRVGPNNTLLPSEGTATQVQAWSRDFIAGEGQISYVVPFDLLVNPVILRNGIEMPATAYSASGSTILFDPPLIGGSEMTVKVGEAIPHPLYELRGPFLFRDLSPGAAAAPPPGIYMGQGGNSLSFETLISSDTGTAETDNQRGMLLLVSETSDDGNSEEQTLCLLTTINTGYARPWLPNTAYNAGDNISREAPVNGVYRCIQAGTSAPSGAGPTGTGSTIVDGSCIWMWINAQAINAKVGIYNEIVVKENAGNSWGQANNFELHAGFKSPFAVATEFDLSNYSGIDSVFGGVTRHNLYVFTKGDTTSTASIEVATTNTDKWAALWGLHFSGGDKKLASNSVIGIDSDSAYGIGFGVSAGGAFTPTFSDSAIKDGSNAQSGVQLAGDYSAQALSITGNAPAAISITGNIADWMIYTPGAFRVDKNGNLRARSLTITDLIAPASSTAPGTAGTITADANHIYVCVADNQWKRAALSTF